MICIYDSTETNFKHNGLSILNNCIRCEVEEELNGYYGLELEYPIFDKKSEYLIKDNIIKVPTQLGLQLFRIYRPVKNMSTITVYCRHIFYDLLYNFLEDCRPTECIGHNALNNILNSTQYSNKFKGFSNISKISTAYYIRKNPIEAIMSEEKNSFLNRWGGEILRDNFNISILNSIGEDNGITISYGKNLLSLEKDLDMSKVITRIMPTGLTENDQIIILPEKYIDSPLINNYPFPKTKHLHFTDIKVDNEKNITYSDVQRMLREKVQELYSINKVDIPKINYKVNFQELSKTEDYKNYRALEKVKLGDIVTIKHKKLNIDIKAKVIKYVWDCLLGKYLNIELGNFKENLSKDLNNISSSIEDVKEDMQENNKKIRSKIDQQDNRITLAVEEVNKTKASIEITMNEITSKVKNMEANTSSQIDQKADSISLTVNDQLKKMNSKIKQQADNISLVVNGTGKINGASIAMAITENKSAISMLADTIEIKPKDGVIHFPNGTDIDTRDSNGKNNPNHIRLRADWNSYVLVDTVGTHVYRSLDGSTTKAVWTFNENGAYFKGKKVKLQFE